MLEVAFPIMVGVGLAVIVLGALLTKWSLYDRTSGKL
jgi:hypothetical protein